MASVALKLQGQAVVLGIATVFLGGLLASALSDDAAQPLGVAAAGTSTAPARADHVHAMPDAGDVGAVPASSVGKPGGVAPLDDTGKMPVANLPSGAQPDWDATSGVSQILNKPAIAVSGIGSVLIGTNLNAVALGAGASVTNNNGVAVGTNAVAYGGVAIGYGAKSPGTAVGINSQAASLDSVSVGVLASARPQYSMAFGYGATAAWTNAVAIGALVNATAPNQAMLMGAGSTVTTGGLVQLSAYTAASLNAMSTTTAPVGCIALATDALDVGEAAGAGTGCMALKKSTGWVRLADNTPLAT